MEDQSQNRHIKVRRIGGYLHRVIPILDKSGKTLSYALKPLMVEFKARDVLQVMVGSSILAIPLAFTEETWRLGEILPLMNVLFLSLLSIVLIAVFVYFNFYRSWLKGNVIQYVYRVFGTYFLALVVVGIILTVIQKCPWGLDNILAIKRILIIAFPASMSATVSDTLK